MSHLTLSFGPASQYHAKADPLAQRLEQSFALHKAKLLRVPEIQQDLIRASVLVTETPDVPSANSDIFADLRSTSMLDAADLSDEEGSPIDRAFRAHRTRLGELLQPVLLSQRHSLQQDGDVKRNPIGDGVSSAACNPSQPQREACLLEVPCLISKPQVRSINALRNEATLNIRCTAAHACWRALHHLCQF